MTWLGQLLVDMKVRLLSLVGRGHLRSRVDEEMQLHIEMRAEQLIDEVLSPEEAWARARRAFGNPAVIRDATIDMWRYGNVERLIQDVRYASRVLARAPGFTAVAVISLALGIGANTAIFSLVDRVLLRVLPVENPQELVVVSSLQSYPTFAHFRDHSDDVFNGLMAVTSLTGIGVDGSEEHDSFIDGRLISGTYFGVLGVRPFMGRLIGPDDDRVPGGHPVAVVSHGFWRRHFNGDPAVLGRTIRLSPGRITSGQGTSGFEPAPPPGARAVAGGTFEIIGVAAPGFVGETIGQHPDVWVPMMMQERLLPGRRWLERRTAVWVHLMARLKPGVARAQAQARVIELFRETRIADGNPAPTEEQWKRIVQRVQLLDGHKGFNQIRGEFSSPLLVLMGMVAVVLLVACANLANLLLARASARTREISLRLAMGASRARVVRQLLTESVLLAGAGGVAAIVVAAWGSQGLFAIAARGVPAARLDLAPDLRTFAFTAAVALTTALLFGLVPAIRATRVDMNTALKEGSRSAASGGGIGKALVAVQVALCVVLLVGTGLFTRTLYNMKSQDLGYTPENIILMRVDPITAGYRGDDIGRMCVQLLDAIRALPGVRAATFSENGLFSGSESASSIRIDGFTPSNAQDSQVRFDQVGPGYFTNVGIPILVGRDFTDADTETSPRVGMINESMARFYFGDRNPVGRLVHYDDEITLTIIGVSANAHDHSLRQVIPRRMYVSFRQPVDGLTGANYEVRTDVDPAVMARQLRSAVAGVSTRLPIASIKPLTTLIDESLLQERLVATLSLFFGIVSVLLASIGLYGILAYSVQRRTNEIGVRLAIGAIPRAIVWMILRETLVLLMAGIAVGVPVALGLARSIESLLFGLEPSDPVTVLAVVGLMLTVGIAAAVAPSRRAARIDPVRALRYE